jgi:hypothetical protein
VTSFDLFIEQLSHIILLLFCMSPRHNLILCTIIQSVSASVSSDVFCLISTIIIVLRFAITYTSPSPTIQYPILNC